jgi:hypothetical protein
MCTSRIAGVFCSYGLKWVSGPALYFPARAGDATVVVNLATYLRPLSFALVATLSHNFHTSINMEEVLFDHHGFVTWFCRHKAEECCANPR